MLEERLKGKVKSPSDLLSVRTYGTTTFGRVGKSILELGERSGLMGWFRCHEPPRWHLKPWGRMTMSGKGRGPGRVVKMLLTYSTQLSRGPTAGQKGCAGAPDLRNSPAYLWVNSVWSLRTHRQVGTWCSASRCLSPEFGCQVTQRGMQGG